MTEEAFIRWTLTVNREIHTAAEANWARITGEGNSKLHFSGCYLRFCLEMEKAQIKGEREILQQRCRRFVFTIQRKLEMDERRVRVSRFQNRWKLKDTGFTIQYKVKAK
jgi:hypothetical protein